MKKKNKNWKWVDENGKIWRASQIEHKFDTYIKKVIKHLVRDAVACHIRQVAHFPVQPDDILNDAVAVEMESTLEKYEVRLYSTTVFLDNEKLAEALPKLKAWEKRLIELDYVLECTEEDIAECLGIEKESVFTYRYRVLRKLERLMEATDGKR